MLKCSNVKLSYNHNLVLSGVNLKIGKKERIGLVGPNGVGKSTLLKVLAGIISPDVGYVEVYSDTLVGYLPQEFTDAELKMTPLGLIIKHLGYGEESDIKEGLCDLCDDFSFDARLLSRKISDLSGGERSKVAILRTLFSYYDVYLLDEPTNNLDMAGLIFLENFIKDSSATFVIVSHDRKFLDRLVTKVVEIDEYDKNTKVYKGSYTDYCAKKQAEIERQWEQYQNYQDEVRRLKTSIRDKKQWALQGKNKPKVTDHDKFIKGFYKDRSAKLARYSKGIEKRMTKLEEQAIEKPKERLPLDFTIEPLSRSGDIVFELKGVVKKLPFGILGPIDVVMAYREKIALIGRNGIGKTTLLEMLVGKIKPDKGSIRRGSQLQIGYLEQFPFKDVSMTVLDFMLPSCGNNQTEARRVLHWFALTTDDIKKPISFLSPGERSRLILASLAASKPNCLLLDEPSNHLDNEAMISIERALNDYSGTLIVVTHDRYFLDQIKPTKTYLLETNGSLRFINSYEAYEEELQDKVKNNQNG